MSLEADLTDYLHRKIDESPTKSRNIQAIKYYYGMGDSPWPTLEEVAGIFSIGTRERVRQLLHLKFRDHATPSDLPSLIAIIELLEARDFWLVSEFEKELVNRGLTEAQPSLKGIFNLAEDLVPGLDYDLFTHDLQRVTRNTIGTSQEGFLIKKSCLPEIVKLWRSAAGLPGKCGIANLAVIRSKLGGLYSLISALIERTPAAWVKGEGDDFLFLYENRDNPILGFSKKIFAVISECEPSVLASSIRNALNARTCQYGYPDESIIEAYLRSSVHFLNQSWGLRYLGAVGALSAIEQDVVSFLEGATSQTFPEFKRHLEDRRYGNAHIIKTINNSPLVIVNRQLGRRNHIYSLIPQARPQECSGNEEKLYESYLFVLRSLLEDGTDSRKVQNSRKEQDILKDWLFKGKASECCAICGLEYSVKTLVTAHKKRRAECNDAERLDPYVVMPLCKMGCDYLYENMHVYIAEGKVLKGVEIGDARAETEYLAKIVGREVDSRWLMGDPSYFRSPVLESASPSAG